MRERIREAGETSRGLSQASSRRATSWSMSEHSGLYLLEMRR